MKTSFLTAAFPCAKFFEDRFCVGACKGIYSSTIGIVYTLNLEIFRACENPLSKTLERLRANLPYDGLFFYIHGAMSVEGLDDPERDMITRIRGVS